MDETTLVEGDRVYLKTDPERDEGTVVQIMHARPFVLWDNGRTWIYPSSWLVRIEPVEDELSRVAREFGFDLPAAVSVS